MKSTATLNVILSLRLVCLAVGCSTSSTSTRIDAISNQAIDSAICPQGVSTWRDAYREWNLARCVATRRCFPDKFATWGSIEACLADLSAWNCIGWVPEGSCDWLYPRDRCEMLTTCLHDSVEISCDPNAFRPMSCHEALR